MTVIAFDGVRLAADSRGSASDGLHYVLRKLVRLNDGSVFAASGEAQDSQQVIAWLNAGGIGPRPVVHEHFTALRVSLEHDAVVCERLENKLFPFRVRAPHAIGCGRDFAYSAMHFGHSAMWAVFFAARFNCACGPPVVSASPNEHGVQIDDSLPD